MDKVLIKGQLDFYKSVLEKKIVVLINLFYIDSWQQYMSYVENIPHNIDVIILSSNIKLLEQVKQYVVSKSLSNVFIEYKENRGRDISALLVSGKKYIMECDYFCYVHDKSYREELLKEDTFFWIDNLWQNMLGNTGHIVEIINYFETNKKIGLLLPPVRLGKVFPCDDGWGVNYDNVIELGKRLGLSVLPEPNRLCECQGTAFWARKDALVKLIGRRWKYSDFPDEPMPIDGTINHAVERILEFVAKSEGYGVVTVINSSYALREIRFLENERRVLHEYLQNQGIANFAQLKEKMTCERELIHYCKQYKTIFIYGAGNRGSKCCKLLWSYNRLVSGFLVSGKGGEKLLELPIYSIDEIDITREDGIIIAVSDRFKSDIVDTLENKAIDWFIFF